MKRPRAVSVIGVALVAVGLAFTLRPGALGFDSATAFVLLAWAVALVGAGVAVYSRFDRAGPTDGALPRTGDRPAYGAAGDDLSAAVADLGAGERDAAERDRIRERVRTVAVDAMERFRGGSPDGVRDRLTAGDWTDDAAAARLFADGEESAGRAGVEAHFARRVERAADAVAAEVGVGESPDETDDADRTGDRSRVATVPELDRGEERVERTGRWRGVYGLALAGTAVGVLVGRPAVLLAGLAGLGFAAYGRVWDAPAPTLDVERHVETTDPGPGERVRVTLSVTNESGHLLPDVRISDGVPAGLTVVEGTPRHTTALRPGKRATISYEFEAVRGRHVFDSLTVVTRDVSGATRRRRRATTDRTAVVCRPRYGETAVPLGDLASRLTGRQDVSATGRGLAVHSLREYRRGDSPSRVDWNRLAKRGELATLQFDEPRTVRVVLVVDARPAAYVTADPPGGRPAVDACARAAGALAGGLLDADCRVGLAALSPRDCWIPPASGGAHRRRLRDRLATGEAFGWRPPAAAESDSSGESADGSESGGESVDRLFVRLPADAQVVVLSPLVDDAPVNLARRLGVRGHDVHVVTPDVTAADTPYRRFASLERRLRLDSVRRAGASVHEWRPSGEPDRDRRPRAVPRGRRTSRTRADGDSTTDGADGDSTADSDSVADGDAAAHGADDESARRVSTGGAAPWR